MACGTNTYNMTTINTKNTTNENTIAGLLKRIDTLQRNAIATNALSTCDNCLVNSMFNTKPINIYCGCDLFTATFNGVDYTLFRVEEVRGNETVVLRLLEVVNDVVTCTANTIIVNINAIFAIQCNAPINCTISCFQA